MLGPVKRQGLDLNLDLRLKLDLAKTRCGLTRLDGS